MSPRVDRWGEPLDDDDPPAHVCDCCGAGLLPENRGGVCAECRLLVRNGDLAVVLWAPVPGYERRYEASSDGSVRHARSKRRLHIDHSGKYDRVTLDGTRMYLHDVVMAAFCGVKPEGQLVLHADDDGHHNRLSNLSYGSHAENHADWRRNTTKATAASDRREGEIA